MTRKAPYQISRSLDYLNYGDKPVYYFILKNEVSGRVVDQRYSTSPIPPRDMLRRQALFNTHAVLD